MFGIGRMIMMLDLRVNITFRKEFVRTTEVVLAWDMLLKNQYHKMCMLVSENTLWASYLGKWGWVDASGMATPL